MIESEILDIVADKTDSGKRLNALVDQFRHGRNVFDLVTVLSSSNPELVAIGAWILGELPFELYNTDDLISRLRELTNHKDPAVRFSAFGALFPALDRTDTSTQALLRKMCNDPNEGVRRSAEAAASRLLWQLNRGN